MTYDTTCTQCNTEAEISKPMAAPLPKCELCGGELKRVYNDVPAHYKAADFFTTDNRLEKLVGTHRARRFEAQKADVLKRQRAGRLTSYEQALETI